MSLLRSSSWPLRIPYAVVYRPAPVFVSPFLPPFASFSAPALLFSLSFPVACQQDSEKVYISIIPAKFTILMIYEKHNNSDNSDNDN